MDNETKMWRQYSKVARALLNDKTARYDAVGNRILMKLTFDEWKEVWLSSGKYHLRGRTVGCYCMSRKGDIGHYEVGNVFIQPHGENVREKNLKFKATDETKQKMSESHKGMTGRKHSEESKRKISEKALGRIGWSRGKIRGPASEESIEKNRQAQLRRWAKIRGELSSQTA